MKKIYLAIILLGLLATAALQAETVVGNSSVSAKKQTDGLYTITIKDSQGIKNFALKSPGNFPYGGDVDGCPRVFIVNNVSPRVVNDFTGEVDAEILDCQNNSDELEIPEIGDKKSVAGKHEEPPAPAVKPAPAPAPAATPSEVAPAVTEEIVFPVSELGNCADKDACKLYCEEPGNMRKCIDFAERHNLISEKEADEGKKFSGIINSRGGGPGGCKTRESCEAYCENVENIDACLAFAENSNLIDAKELDEMRKVAKLLKEGAEFPGGCKSKSQCEAYCSDPDNMEACLVFAEKAGFIPPEELEMAKKVVPLMKAGKTPGGCKSKESCEAYCENPDNIDACIAFAEQMGFMTPEEVAIVKKTGGKGPGGCRGKQQCEDFCQNPENQETCFSFAKDNGLISEEDQKQMDEGMKFIREALSDESTGLGQCLSASLGPDNVARIKGGQPIFDRGLEDKLKGCFEQFPPGGGDGGFPGGGPGGGGFGGPGGCTSQEECQAYCEERPEECQQFAPPGGGGTGPVRCGTEENPEECQQLEPPHQGGGGGPGGCQSPEECQAYCEEHLEECKDFGPPSGGGSGSGGVTPIPGPTPPSFSGPGGCTSPETCMAYCQDHYTDPACSGGGGTPPPAPQPAPAPTSSAQSCAPVPPGIVSWWPGGDVTDIIGGNHAKAFLGSKKIGKIGYAFRGEHMNMGNPANLNFGTGPFSLETWFNWDGGGNSGALNIIRKSNYPVSGPGAGYWLRISRDNQLIEFSVGATTGPEGQSLITAPINSQTWHHVAATRDSSDNIKLYIDGQSTGAVVRKAVGANSTSEAPFTLGAWDDRFGVTEIFPGFIDEVSVYNRALNSSEIQAIYNAGSAGKCSQSSTQNEFQLFLGVLLNSLIGPFLQ